MSKSKILFFMSGSIAAFKACQVISRLVQEGNEVQCVATPSALKFIGAATLEGLTGKAVLSDLWEHGRAMDHIHLTRWADFAVLCPASANTLAKISRGLADDLTGAMVLAWPKEKPFHIFPAMNHAMLSNPITQENLKIVAKHFTVHSTQEGSLACGEEGGGRMLEAEDILNRVKPAAKSGRILITGGATRESIDGIRFISNVSSGQTAATLAAEFARKNWDVTYLHGVSAVKANRVAKKLCFESFENLNETLRAELASVSYDAVIHCAAVSDYSVDKVNEQKPDSAMKLSSQDDLNIRLKKNFKILPCLREYSRNKEIRVVGFKLTLNQSAEEAQRIARDLLSTSVDLVVANDWSQVNADRTKHPGQLISQTETQDFATLDQLVQLLNQILTRTRDAKGGSRDSMS